MAFEEETITTAHAQSVNQINLDEVGDNQKILAKCGLCTVLLILVSIYL